MILIDSHAHLNFSAFKNDSEETAQRALKSGVWLINAGSQIDTSKRAVEFAQKFKEGVFAAVGLHPIHLKEQAVEEEETEVKTRAEIFDPEKYETLARDKKVVAIGEVGLDYFHSPENKELQRETLLEQLILAEKLEKPVIFHCRAERGSNPAQLGCRAERGSNPAERGGRDAHDDLLDILKKWELSGNKSLRGVIHSFSGRFSQAEEYLKMGFYLGFNGIITFARDYDKVVCSLPLERLILETDCPYLTPIPFRGKRNEPAYVKYVAEKVAELRGISFEEVAEITTKNAKELFKI